jgi:hypothetical protein
MKETIDQFVVTFYGGWLKCNAENQIVAFYNGLIFKSHFP